MEGAIRISLREILKECSTEQLANYAQRVTKTLSEKGMTSLAHINLAKEEDLLEIFNQFQARRVIQGWKTHQFLQLQEDAQASTSDAGIGPSLTTYRAPFGKISSKTVKDRIMAALNAGQRLEDTDRLAFINACVTDAIERWPKRKRDVMGEIGDILLIRYPTSFTIKLGGSAAGREEFRKQLKDQFDNRNRGKAKASKETEDTMDKRKINGSINWLPAKITTSEAESMEQVKEDMINYYRETHKRDWNWDDIKENLEKTYPLQRRDINGQTRLIDQENKKKKKGDTASLENSAGLTTAELFNSWPFLFEPKGMAFHFKYVTEIDMIEKLSSYENEKLDHLIKFLSQKGDIGTVAMQLKLETARKKGFEYVEYTAMILLLIKYFGEDREELIRNVDKTLKWNDLKEDDNLPPTPSIMISGNKDFEPKKFYFCLDSQPVSIVRNMKDGIILLMGSFFVFNLLYPLSAALSLEFIQRDILGINPIMGSRKPKSSLRKSIIPKKILKLVSDFETFQKELAALEEGEVVEDEST